MMVVGKNCIYVSLCTTEPVTSPSPQPDDSRTLPAEGSKHFVYIIFLLQMYYNNVPLLLGGASTPAVNAGGSERGSKTLLF